MSDPLSSLRLRQRDLAWNPVHRHRTPVRWHWCSDKAGNGESARKCLLVRSALPQLQPVDSRSRGTSGIRTGCRLPSFPRERESTGLTDHGCGRRPRRADNPTTRTSA